MLFQSLCRSRFYLSCVPWLHGHYPASRLLRTLCPLAGGGSSARTGHERRLLVPARDPCLPSLNLPTVPSPTTRCHPRHLGLAFMPRLTARVSLASPLWGPGRLGFRLSLAGSPQQLAESSSLTYGPVVRLRLLSTPPCGDAVTFDYRGQVQPRVGTLTPPIQCAHRRTRGRDHSRRPPQTRM